MRTWDGGYSDPEVNVVFKFYFLRSSSLAIYSNGGYLIHTP